MKKVTIQSAHLLMGSLGLTVNTYPTYEGCVYTKVDVKDEEGTATLFWTQNEEGWIDVFVSRPEDIETWRPSRVVLCAGDELIVVFPTGNSPWAWVIQHIPDVCSVLLCKSGIYNLPDYVSLEKMREILSLISEPIELVKRTSEEGHTHWGLEAQTLGSWANLTIKEN